MGFLCFFYITRLTNDLAAQVVTGFMDGNAVSTKQRLALLYQGWMPHAGGAAGVALFFAAAQMQMANNVGDSEIKLLAYMAAVIAVSGSISWLINGTFLFFHYRGIVREAEAH
jgi:hypothetical protein